MPETETHRAAASAVFTYRNFALYQTARLFTVLAAEMQSVAVAWQVYEITRRPFALGMVGLAQFLPAFALFLIAGHAGDRFDRRKILLCCYAGFALCSSLLLAITLHGATVHPIYAVLVLVGVVRSFSMPTGQAFLPQLVAEKDFPRAFAWGATVFQAATIVGPALGGMIYALAHGPAVVYATSAVACLAAIVAVANIKSPAKTASQRKINTETLLAGFGYIWRNKVILGSISLDLFAVLLGGAVALLPVYAKEILRTGPWGLGLLRSAPGMGAAAMAIAMAHWPLRRRAGAAMLWCVAAFGVCTIVFGISRNLIISMIALLLVGASDMVSVIVRGTLVQLLTPDEMRGRVSAVNMLFVGGSNEFGEFESGLTAQWFGAVPAVILGGVGALIVTAVWAWRFPELRKAEMLTAVRLK